MTFSEQRSGAAPRLIRLPGKALPALLYGRPQAYDHVRSRGPVTLGRNIHDSMVGYIYVTDFARGSVAPTPRRIENSRAAERQLPGARVALRV